MRLKNNTFVLHFRLADWLTDTKVFMRWFVISWTPKIQILFGSISQKYKYHSHRFCTLSSFIPIPTSLRLWCHDDLLSLVTNHLIAMSLMCILRHRSLSVSRWTCLTLRRWWWGLVHGRHSRRSSTRSARRRVWTRTSMSCATQPTPTRHWTWPPPSAPTTSPPSTLSTSPVSTASVTGHHTVTPALVSLMDRYSGQLEVQFDYQ